MAVYANARTQADFEGKRLSPEERADDCVAAQLCRAMGRTVSKQPDSERPPAIPAKTAEAQSR